MSYSEPSEQDRRHDSKTDAGARALSVFKGYLLGIGIIGLEINEE